MKPAKSRAGERYLQTGHASNESSAAAAPPIADEDGNVDARTERDARSNSQPDDVTEMLREADALAAQSANLRQISDAAKPLYDSLDDRHAGGSCSSCMMFCGRTKWTIHATGAADL